MKSFRRHVRLLLVTLTLAASLSPAGTQASGGQNTNSSTTMQDDGRIMRETQQCVRDADKRYQRCLRRSGRNKGRRARCRRTHRQESSACSG